MKTQGCATTFARSSPTNLRSVPAWADLRASLRDWNKNGHHQMPFDDRKLNTPDLTPMSNDDPPPSLFVIGYPGDVGGANTECWHTVKLWRAFGVDVTLVPTWKPTPKWRDRLAGIGCRTIQADPERLGKVPGLPGGTVVSFCNSHFLRSANQFRHLGCKIVWVGCMNWLFAEERKHYRRHGPFDRYVFQSEYQRSELMPQLAKFGVKPDQCHLIRGAFAWNEYPFRPLAHARGKPFVVGRISRAAKDKFSGETWEIYRRIPHPMRARLMAWDGHVRKKLGRPPEWAECLAAQAESAEEFLGKLHCMLQVNGGASENWPRSGLEAMACGVPVVAENRWGWREMIRHGRTGFLADSADELAFHAARLAYDEELRIQIARRARKALEEELANPHAFWAGWQKLLGGLALYSSRSA
jgi:glycosyl transferase family 1